MPFVDTFQLGADLLYLVESGILLVGIVRSFQLAKGFTKGLFRSRAYWLAGLMICIIVGDVSYFYPSPTSVTTFLDLVVSTVAGFGFVAAVPIAVIFVDRNLRVMQEVDFFHRDALRWSRLRRYAIGASMIVSIELAIFLLLGGSGPNISVALGTFVALTYFPVMGVSLGYAGVALVTAARRTPDRTMRRFSLLLGFALVFAVVGATIWLPTSLLVASSGIISFVSAVPSLAAGYVLYLTAKSLSPLGRLNAEITVDPAVGPAATTTKDVSARH